MNRSPASAKAVELLLTHENVTHHGRFHTIENTTSLPRPTQRPRPKFYVAALNTPDSFAFAGCMGYSVMAIPLGGAVMRPLLAAYRDAWKTAGHPGEGEVMLAFHMFCDADGARARAFACPFIDDYLHSLVEAASDWLDGRTSEDYPGYDRVIAKLRQSRAADQISSGTAWIGSPEEILGQVRRTRDAFGRYEHARQLLRCRASRFLCRASRSKRRARHDAEQRQATGVDPPSEDSFQAQFVKAHHHDAHAGLAPGRRCGIHRKARQRRFCSSAAASDRSAVGYQGRPRTDASIPSPCTAPTTAGCRTTAASIPRASAA